MTRAIVNVATGERYQRGQARLMELGQHLGRCELVAYRHEPAGSPKHSDVPYAFKAFALKHVADSGADILLWADSCILPVRSLEPLWARIERDGYWISNNGFSNYEWTADSAYRDLFSELSGMSMDSLRSINRDIKHVVATAFGLSMRHGLGRAFLAEYYRLASETRAFCGPAFNSNYAGPVEAWRNRPGAQPCGPPDVAGHRHDQSAASVIAWRLGFKLTNCPEIFAYPPTGWPNVAPDERTILLAEGSYA